MTEFTLQKNYQKNMAYKLEMKLLGTYLEMITGILVKL